MSILYHSVPFTVRVRFRIAEGMKFVPGFEQGGGSGKYFLGSGSRPSLKKKSGSHMII